MLPKIFLFLLMLVVCLGLDPVFAGSFSYKLKILGYRDKDIQAIVRGEKSRLQVDQELKLRMIGCEPDEAAAMASRMAPGPLDRRPPWNPGLPYAGLVYRKATRVGIDPNLVMAVIQAESNFDPRAVSTSGAAGLMQLMPGTASDLGVSDRFDPVQNIAAGVCYLARCLKQFDDLYLFFTVLVRRVS